MESREDAKELTLPRPRSDSGAGLTAGELKPE